MTKVVINRCFGGFGLSEKATRLYAKAVGITLYVDKRERVYGPHYYLCPPDQYESLSNEEQHKMFFCDRDIDRTDKALIDVVETLGEEANGWAASLKVVEIPDDVDWVIEEYDGNEWVAEVHRTWS